MEQDELLYFTIGETRRGKFKGLSDRLRAIVAGEGLQIREIRSTAGSRPDAVYVGFSLSAATEEQVRRILERADQAIRSA